MAAEGRAILEQTFEVRIQLTEIAEQDPRSNTTVLERDGSRIVGSE